MTSCFPVIHQLHERLFGSSHYPMVYVTLDIFVLLAKGEERYPSAFMDIPKESFERMSAAWPNPLPADCLSEWYDALAESGEGGIAEEVRKQKLTQHFFIEFGFPRGKWLSTLGLTRPREK